MCYWWYLCRYYCSLGGGLLACVLGLVLDGVGVGIGASVVLVLVLV